jgi:hypothetical protein
MQDASQAASNAQANKPPPELSSILTQVQTLQSDRERLQKELEEARQKMDKLQVTPRPARLCVRASDPAEPRAQAYIHFPNRADASRLLRVLFRRRGSVRR